jgi:hypothetical protein
VVQNVLLLTIVGDKFVIYVPIRRYGDFSTLQSPVQQEAIKKDNPEKPETSAKTRPRKTKTQHNISWTTPYANKHKSHGTQNLKT